MSLAGRAAGAIVCFVLAIAGTASAEAGQATSADAFVDSIGVNTHYGNSIYTGANAYANPLIDARLGALGVRHIRDHSWNDAALARVDAINAAYGIKANLIVGETTRTPADLVNLLKAHPAYEAIEGLNEPDFAGNRSYNGLTDDTANNLFPATRAFQNDLFAAVNADPQTAARTVLSPAMGRSYRAQYLAPIDFDVAAMHSYPWATPQTSAKEPSANVDQALSDLSALRADKPLWATESGYYNQPASNARSVPESVSGKYIPRLYGEFFNRGIERTYIYELADQGPDQAVCEQNFGLLRYDLGEKPAYTALKNLIALLAEPGADFDPSTLDFTLSAPDTVHHTLLQKSDGRYYVLLWNEVLSYDSVNHVDLNVADVAATLTLPAPFDVRIFKPGISADALATQAGANSLDLSVPDQMMVVELTPVPEPAMIGAGLLSIVLLRRRHHARGEARCRLS